MLQYPGTVLLVPRSTYLLVVDGRLPHRQPELPLLEPMLHIVPPVDLCAAECAIAG